MGYCKQFTIFKNEIIKGQRHRHSTYLARRGRTDAELVLLGAKAQALRLAVDNKTRDSTVALRPVTKRDMCGSVELSREAQQSG
jgi:hypothetical protein